jgi:transaldolase
MIRTGLAALTVLNAGSLHPFSMMRLLVDATTNPSIIMRIAIKGNNHERN